MSVESRPNKLTKGLVLDTFHTDVDNTVATYALNSQLEDQEGNHFHYGSEVGTTYIKDIPANHVVVGHINMERNETVLFTTDGTNSTIGILSRKDDMSYNYEIKVDDSKQEKKLGFKKEGYVRGVYRLLNGCDKVIYFVDGINKDRRININQLDSYKLPTTASVASGIIFDDSLRATIYALSSATGNIQLIRLLSASPEATANVLANLSSGAELTKLLTASANGIGTALANLTRTANMIISTNATGTSTANVDIVRLLQSNVSAIGSINAILESSQQGVVEIDVTLTGVASSTAILLRTAILEANLTTEASVVVEAILTRIINAQVQATADTSATAQLTVPVNATANATATTAADAILSYAVNATANAIANTEATSQLSKVITASVDAVANSSSEALIGLVLVSTTTANGSVSTADLYINRLLTSSVTAQGTTTAEALIAKLLQSSLTSTATATSDALVSKLATSSITAQAITTADSLISKLLTSTVNSTGNVTANLQLADLLSTALSGTATTEAVLEAINLLIGDPYIDNVSLLLQGDDNPSGVTQNNTFKDSSTNNFTITRNGNVTQGTFSPFDRALTNSGGSAYFDGTGDYLTIADNAALELSNSNFTIEAWIYMSIAPSSVGTILGKRVSAAVYGGYQFGVGSDRRLQFVADNDTSFDWGVVVVDTAGREISLNTWNHVAITRSASTWTLWLNGVSGTTTTSSITINDQATSAGIGAIATGEQSFNGYISNLRVVKGTAVYTSNFNPSTIPLTAITNTSLLLNFTNAAIFDGVKLNNIETVGGAQISTAQNKFPTGSILFDGTGDYLTIPNTVLANFGNNNFTVEFWIYMSIQSLAPIVHQTSYFGNQGWIIWNYDGVNVSAATRKLTFMANGATFSLTTSSDAYTDNNWTHIAIVKNGTGSNNIRIYSNGISIATGTYATALENPSTPLMVGGIINGQSWNGTLYLNGYIDDLRITKGIARYTTNFNTNLPNKLSSLIPNYLVSRSLRFNSADSTYLSRTPTVAGNRRTWTYSTWVKRSEINSTGGILATTTTAMSFGFNNELFFMTIAGVGNAYTTSVFRDTSAWYHVVIVFNTLESVSSNRVLIYINNINYPLNNTLVVQNTDYHINNNIVHQIGTTGITGSSTFLNSYMTEVNFIDGQALTPNSFGIRNTSTGVWSPKEYTGTYGNNGFHLNFSDITQLGKDYSGNNNNWTPSGFSVTPGVGYDSLIDIPSVTVSNTGTDNGFGGEVRGNYATLNPLENQSLTITNGNLDASNTTAVWKNIKSTFSMPSGKWYFEFVHTTGIQYTQIGVIKTSIQLPTTYFSQSPFGWSYSAVFGELRNNDNTTNSGIFTSAIGDIINVAVDIDTGKIWFGKNGTWFNNGVPSSGINAAYTNLSGEMSVAVGVYNTNNPLVSFNSGQRPFVYQAPTGFKALNTANLPTPAIGGGGESNLANKYMDITTYTGTGAAQSIFNSGFKPDFVWIKSRSAATSHAIYDISRGVQKRLSSDLTNAQVIDTTGLSSFDNTGFSIGALADINTSGATYIAWQWRAGGTPVTNNGGATPSQVSVSQISGFSVVSYTGTSSATTIGHGLGVAPKMIIIKNVNNIATWAIYHDSLGSGSPQTYYLDFSNNLQSISTAYWNSIKPTVNNFSIGVGTSSVNSSGNPFIAYCFAEIEGYSKFSSYLGNNSTDGTFVYTGFKPKYILIKCITAAGNWALYNSIVNTGNPVINELFANTTAAENSVANDDIDFLSNGFKLRSTNAAINAAQTYIYAAFAETPFKYATAALTPELKETVTVDYLVIAGGGGGGNGVVDSSYGGGGGAGGYRTSAGTSGGGASAESQLNLTPGVAYTVTVGGGGAAITKGSNSVLSTITSEGGGLGASTGGTSGNGGSGGGRPWIGIRGLGTANQGYDGGNHNAGGAGAGGGGAGATASFGSGGVGVASSITGSPVTRAVGGGSGVDGFSTANSGNGGNSENSSRIGRPGGSGIVIISYPDTYGNVVVPVGLYYKNSSGVKTQGTGISVTPTNTTGGKKIYEFLEGSGNIQFT